MMPDMPVFHGGELGLLAARFPDAPRPWIDLSTGINPWPYPVPALPDAAWQRLPGHAETQRLLAAAAACYGAPGPDHVAAAPGSQALIQLLPRLRPAGRVAVLGPTYGEHEACWRAAGHAVERLAGAAPDGEASGWDVVVTVNPNNPDGRRLDPAGLERLRAALAARGGWLVVDEAFADVAPDIAMAGAAGRPGLIVLRSFGKFFGLAGLRLGFALAAPALRARIEAALGPWAVSGPAIAIATAALADEAWIAATRQRLAAAAARLDGVLAGAGLELLGGTALFRLARGGDELFDRLGRAGILARHFPDHPGLLRLGLPPDEAAFGRLQAALG